MCFILAVFQILLLEFMVLHRSDESVSTIKHNKQWLLLSLLEFMVLHRSHESDSAVKRNKQWLHVFQVDQDIADLNQRKDSEYNNI